MTQDSDDTGPEVLGMELAPPLERLVMMLDRCDLTTQYLLTGFLAVFHAISTGKPEWSQTVLTGFERHTRQILAQHDQFRRERAERRNNDETIDGDQRMMSLLHMVAKGSA